MFSRQAVFRSARAAAAPTRIAASVPARRFAAEASEQVIKPPVAVFGLDGTYATALYTAGAKMSTLEPISKAMASLNDAVSKDAKLESILETPTLTTTDKSAIVKELQKLAGPGGSQAAVSNFLEALAENNRLSILKGVCDKFRVLMSAAQGEVELIVTSAQPLDNKTLNRLQSAATKSEYIKQGQKLKVTNNVNPEIVGGLVVEVGDRTIDVSVSARVAKLNKLLTDAL
ncbi:putative oligomycin sensitivity conferring protein [Zalerion maritima]|uniref:ATP synthase subunit 5, mitochondrial n=1 Tax=Zalerion maritima TaxID=339359 RepID=A0AAD5WRK9_9PEZI|nr:putative oligomycin sensitivity conferring protein [Zalerion maritima]